MKLTILFLAIAAFAAEDAKAPAIPMEHELEFANAEGALREAQIRFTAASQALTADCKTFALARDMKSRRFACVAKPEGK